MVSMAVSWTQTVLMVMCVTLQEDSIRSAVRSVRRHFAFAVNPRRRLATKRVQKSCQVSVAKYVLLSVTT